MRGAGGPWASGVISLPAEISRTLISVLHDEADRGDRQIREALFLTFGADLGFFESQVLGPTRATGAAITVVADAHVYEPDPRAVRSAGVRYAVGLAAMPAVFHPKLVVLAGPARATVAIGSGNLTLGGWHLNDEVLTVVSGDSEAGCPPLFRQLAVWLEDLPDAIRIGATAARGIRRTAAELIRLCDAAPVSGGAPVLAANLTEPLVEQLPRDLVDELLLFAPFHDLRGRGFDKLLGRVGPRGVRIALQERFTVVDPDALIDVAKRHGVSLTFESSEGTAYRHGKIIEARRDGQVVWTLSGSPNLSVQALNTSVRSGGNCELAVLDRSAGGLYPATTGTLQGSELVAVRSGPPASEDTPPERAMADGLLEASLDESGILLTFAHPLPSPLVVEVSEYTADPDHFKRLAELPAGSDEYSVPADPDWTFPVRLRLAYGERHGPVHFVTRLDAVTLRATGPGGTRAPDLDPEQIFADFGQAADWLRVVNQLALQTQTATAPLGERVAASVTTRVPTGFTGPVWDDPATWPDYVEDASARLGDALVSFALGGLPRLSSAPQPGRATWEDDFTAQVDVAADNATDKGGQTSAEDSGPDHAERERVPVERARYRRWLHTLLDGVEKHQAIDRASRGALMMIATRLKIWELDGEAPWFDLLATATKALAGDDIPSQQWPITCAQAQVMLYLLADGAAAIGSRSAVETYRAAEASVRRLLEPVAPELIEHFTESLRANGLLTPDTEFIALHAAESLSSDATVQALHLLEMRHSDLQVIQASGSLLTVSTDNVNPLIAGAPCLEELPGRWGVYVTARTGRRAFLASNDEYLLTAEASGNHVRFRTYRLGSLTSPNRAANGGVPALEKPRVDTVTGMGARILAELDVDVEQVRAFVHGT